MLEFTRIIITNYSYCCCWFCQQQQL